MFPRMRLLLSILFLPFTAYTQTPVSTNLTRDDGLAGNEVYFAHQDRQGYIWFSTETGLSRFDGSNFRNFYTTDGLSSNVIFRIEEDANGVLWFLTSNAIPSCFDGHRFIKISNPKLDSLVQGSFSLGWLKRENQIVNSLSRYGVVSYEIDTDFQVIHNPTKEIPRCRGENIMIAGLFEGNDSILGVGSMGVLNLDRDTCELLLEWSPWIYPRIAEKGDSVFIGVNGQLYIFNRSTYESELFPVQFDTEIICITVSREGTLWLGTRRGAYCVDLDSRQIIKNLLEGEEVSAILEDNEGGTWFTTLKTGIYYFPDLTIQNYSTKDGLPHAEVNTLMVSPVGVVAGFEAGKIIQFSQSIDQKKFMGSKGRTRFNRILEHKGSTYYAANEYVLAAKDEVLRYYPIPARDIAVSDEHLFITNSSTTIRVPLKDLDQFEVADPTPPYNLQKMGITEYVIMDAPGKKILYQDSILWVGLPEGVVRWTSARVDTILHCEAVTDLEICGSELWVATSGEGIYRILLDSSQQLSEKGPLTQINRERGLVSNFCTSLACIGDGELWVGTKAGISQVRLRGGEMSTRNWTRRLGLPSNTINDLGVDQKGDLWLATQEGLCQLPKHVVESHLVPPKVLIESITVDTSQLDPTASTIDIYPSQTSISIRLGGISYQHSIRFRYRQTEESDWEDIPGNTLFLKNLAPGDYKFFFQAISEAGVESIANLELLIIVHPPFWQSMWFWLLLLGLGIGLIILFFRINVLSFNRQAVRQLIRSIFSKGEQEEPELIFKVVDGSYVKLKFGTILWMKAAREYIEIHTEERHYLTRCTMKVMEKNLDPIKEIQRVHRSYFVNLGRVTGVKTNRLILGDQEVPYSDSYRHLITEYKEKLRITQGKAKH